MGIHLIQGGGEDVAAAARDQLKRRILQIYTQLSSACCNDKIVDICNDISELKVDGGRIMAQLSSADRADLESLNCSRSRLPAAAPKVLRSKLT